LFIVLAPYWASACPPGAQDSIVIDGVMLDVEAQVRFDSLLADPRIKTTTFQAAWTFNAFVGSGSAAPGWWNWSGRPDVNVQCSAELLRFPAQLDRRKRRQWHGHVDAGFIVASLVSIDASTFPDSLIGFLPATATAPLRMVISQQFDIGTETDTLDAVTGRTNAASPFASVGLDAVLSEWQVGIAGGVRYRTRSAQDRPVLNSPTLDGAAYVEGIQRKPGVAPMVQVRIGYQEDRSPWTFQLTGLWISDAPQNHWWGAGVKYDAW
jgi:hypothetical protein